MSGYNSELREIQNKIFGIARSIQGVRNDLDTRHRTRAVEKAGVISDRLYLLADDVTNLQEGIGGI